LPANRLPTLGIAVALVAVIAFGGWYFLLRDDAPPPVDLETAVASVATATQTAATVAPSASATPADAQATSTAVVTAAARDGALDGGWVVSAAGESFAGYRVGEELSNIGTNTAVGRTSDVAGTLEFDGSRITAVDIEVNVASLTSDDSRRDRQLRDRGLQTNSFPTATFSLTTPIDVNPVPSEGEPFAAVASGELTFHGVTRPVLIELSGQLVDGFVVVVGSTEIQFVDFDIIPPTGFIVLAVDDHGIIEFQLVFEPGS
jgi:polyisoprenoid-binding protein YceI